MVKKTNSQLSPYFALVFDLRPIFLWGRNSKGAMVYHAVYSGSLGIGLEIEFASANVRNYSRWYEGGGRRAIRRGSLAAHFKTRNRMRAEEVASTHADTRVCARQQLREVSSLTHRLTQPQPVDPEEGDSPGRRVVVQRLGASPASALIYSGKLWLSGCSVCLV